MQNETDNIPRDSQRSSLDYCLKPLLKWLHWEGNERTLFESLPHLASIKTVDSFRWVMQNLGFQSNTLSLKLNYLDERLLPCLFIPKDNSTPKILIEKVGEGLSIYDSGNDQTYVIREFNIDGVIIFFKKQSETIIKSDQRHWFKNILFQEKKILYYVSFLTFLQTVLLIATPLYIMVIYDNVIAANSMHMLLSIFFGVILALTALTIVMLIRVRLLGHIGTHIQNNIGKAIFRQLLRLAPIYTHNASVAMQIIRLNDYNVLREFFGGPLFSAVIEIPFLLVYFSVVFYFGGVLVLVPVFSVAGSALLAYVSWRFSQKNIRESAIARGQYQDFLLESLTGMRSIQYAGLQKKWLERFRNYSATTSLLGKNILFMNGANDAAFDVIMLISGLSTLIVGTVMVVENMLQVGALVGVMFIIWRILTPIKLLNMMLPKLIQLKFSAKQINDFMRLPVELPTERQWKSAPQHIVGSIAFSQLTFRYPGADSPALKNIDFSLTPGKTLVIIGPSASGKSTIANLILAIYPNQAGHIYIDGRNIKQFDVNVLRKNIAYVPQKPELFYGTVAQNLTLAQPLASKEQLIEAAKLANLLTDIEALPNGFNTHIRLYGDDKFGPSFCQKINLARAYLRDAPILVMDEPTSTLDDESVNIFSNFLQNMKGKKTMVLFGHNTKYLHLADQAIVLYDGYIVTSGDPKTVMENLPKGMI